MLTCLCIQYFVCMNNRKFSKNFNCTCKLSTARVTTNNSTSFYLVDLKSVKFGLNFKINYSTYVRMYVCVFERLRKIENRNGSELALRAF